MRTVAHAWRCPRNAPFRRTIEVPFHDLRGQDQRLQIRAGRNSTASMLSLTPSAGGTQGLFVSFAPSLPRLVGGVIVMVGVSTITIRIDAATIQAMAPLLASSVEPDAEIELAYDHLIALPGLPLLPLMGGPFIIEPGVTIP